MNSNYFNPFFTVKVMDGLFISNQTAAKEQQFIQNNKFSLIINTCPRQFKILSIPTQYKVTNFHWHNMKGQMIEKINISTFEPFFNQITKNIQQGHGTLIVSDRGHSRSITFSLLYLMHRFGWDLFKSLEYINSKRQNLQVRATFLKLLVDYDKSIKKQLSSDNQQNTKQNEDFSTHLKQSNKKQKWNEQAIKSIQQRLISNTFVNTSKRRTLNQLNQIYRQTMLLKNHRQSDSNNRKTIPSSKIYSGSSTKQLKKNKKSVKFSNEIQIIINHSAMTHIFPQYQQLTPQNAQKNSQTHHHIQPVNSNSHHMVVNFSNTNQRIRNGTSNNHNNKHNQTIQQQKQKQQQSASSPSVKDNKKRSSNFAQRKTKYPIKSKFTKQQEDNRNNSYLDDSKQQQYEQLYTKKQTNQKYYNQFVQMTQNYNDSSRKVQQEQIKVQQGYNVQKRNINQKGQNQNMILQQKRNRTKSTHSQQNKSNYPTFYKIKDNNMQNLFIGKNQISNSSNQKFNSHHLNNKQTKQIRNQHEIKAKIRPTSLKKFKINKNTEDKHRVVSSPKGNHQRLLTQPKKDQYYHEKQHLFQEKTFNYKQIRKLSGSKSTDIQNPNPNNNIYQHKKNVSSISSTISNSIFGNFNKKRAGTPFNQKNRLSTPKKTQNNLNKYNPNSNPNQIPSNRPLSQNKSLSFKVTNKKVSPGLMKNEHLNGGNNVFNVNINVNIGKLQMFGNKTLYQQKKTSKQTANGSNETNRYNIIQHRPRSNSTIQNYTKFSSSNQANFQKSNESLVSQKIMKKIMNNKKLKFNEDLLKMSQDHVFGQSYDQYSHNYKNNNQNNQGQFMINDAFNKQRIIQKLNKKLLKNSIIYKKQSQMKTSQVLENNFF